MSRAIKSALGIVRRYGKKYADGGGIRDVIFDPTPMNRKTPHQRVMEGHQEFEPGYVRGWDWNDGPDYPVGIKNMRGQDLQLRRAADGGEIDPEDESQAFAERSPVEPKSAMPEVGMEGMPAYDPSQAPPPPSKPVMMEPDLQSLQMGQRDVPEGYAVNDAGELFNKQTGEVLKQTPRPNVLPITTTPEGHPEFAMPKMLDIAGNLGGGWSVPVSGAEKILGAGMAVPKAKITPPPIPPKAGEVGRTWFDLPPYEMDVAHPIGNAKGTSPGGVFTGFTDGIDRYVKQAKSLDHAKNEVLAAKLYELAGVPVAKTELTQLGGKPAVASHMLDGKQLSELDPWEYEHIRNLDEHMAADAWLANGDVIGAGMENPKGNILVTHGKAPDATRIDFGGAIRYSGLGKPKPFDKDVEPWLKGLKDEYKNPTAAEAFHGHVISPENATAQRIASIPDDQIERLVYQYGPTDMMAKSKLVNTLIARRDGITKAYGIDTHPHIGPEDIVPGFGNKVIKPEFKSLEQEMDELLKENMKLKKQKLAEPDVGWNPKPEAEINIPAVMKLNKLSKPNELVYAVKNQPSTDAVVNKKVTAKQANKIIEHFTNANAKQIAQTLIELDPAQQANAKTWMSPKTVQAVDKFLEDTPKLMADIMIGKYGDDTEKLAKALYEMELYGKTPGLTDDIYKKLPLNLHDDVNEDIKTLIRNKKYDPWNQKEYKSFADEQAEYEAKQAMQASHEAALASGQPGGEFQYTGKKVKPTGALPDSAFQEIKNWVDWKPKEKYAKPPYLHNITAEEAKKRGFNPNFAMYRGEKYHHGATQNDPYPKEFPEAKTIGSADYHPERAIFMADLAHVAGAYSPMVGDYIMRAGKAAEVDWKAINGYKSYSNETMHRLIEEGHKRGYDLLAIHGMSDMGSANHTQYAILNTTGLRSTRAKFDPKQLHLRFPHAGLVGGGLFAYGTLRGQSDESKMASGGRLTIVRKMARKYGDKHAT